MATRHEARTQVVQESTGTHPCESIDNRLTAEITGTLENIQIRNNTIINGLQVLRLHLLGDEIPPPSEPGNVKADNPGQLPTIRDMADEIFTEQDEILGLLDDLSRL